MLSSTRRGGFVAKTRSASRRPGWGRVVEYQNIGAGTEWDSTHRGRLFFSDQRRAQPGKNAFPSRRFAGRKTIARKTQKCTKSCSGASLIGGNARSSPPPRPFQLLGVLGELGVGRFHAKGAKPAKGSLGRSPFCGFSWQFQVAPHRLRV